MAIAPPQGSDAPAHARPQESDVPTGTSRTTDVHLWYARLGALDDSGPRERCRDLLSHYQHDRARSANGRPEHVLAGALVRAVLSRLSGVAATELTFRTNGHGRPEIDGP